MKFKNSFFFLLIFINFFAQHKDSTYYFYFSTGESIQNLDSMLAFEKFFKPFRSCKVCGIKLEGYTDNKGDEKSNQLLALNRINYVKFLIKDTNSIKIDEEVIGERLSQNTINHQAFRMVKLTIHSPVINEKPILRIEAEPKFQKFCELNVPIRLDIHFAAGKFYLLPQSLPDLDLLVEFLKINKQLKIKIVGHVCCSDEGLLSRNRALSVYNYLIDKKIDKNRIVHSGASNKQPLVKEINEETEAINRRVEVYLSLEK